MSTFGLIIDVVIIAILSIFGIIGLKKGLLKSVLSLFSWSVCIVIAFLTAKYVAGWINGIYDFASLIGKGISKSLIKMNDFFAQSINVYQSSGKSALIEASQGLNINKLLKQLIKVVFSNTKVDMTSTDSIGLVVGTSLGHICMVIISGLLVFIVLKVAVTLLSKLFKNIEQTKVLGSLNKILGLILGLLKGALIILVVNVIMVALTLVPAINKTITPLVQDNTHIEKVVYNTTDKFFGKYVIEGDTVKNWVENLWEKR